MGRLSTTECTYLPTYLYAYQGLNDTTKYEEPVEDHLPASITQGASNLHSDGDMEDKIELLDPRVQKLIRTYLEVFGELLSPASCDKLVQMNLKLKPEFVGHKIRRDRQTGIFIFVRVIQAPDAQQYCMRACTDVGF